MVQLCSRIKVPRNKNRAVYYRFWNTEKKPPGPNTFCPSSYFAPFVEIGKRNEATMHKLRTLKVAMIELSLQGMMGRNETWLEVCYQ